MFIRADAAYRVGQNEFSIFVTEDEVSTKGAKKLYEFVEPFSTIEIRST